MRLERTVSLRDMDRCEPYCEETSALLVAGTRTRMDALSHER
jgi:hypothetical protein